MSPQRVWVAVVGPGAAGPEALSVAERVGRELARRDAVLVCGGLGGAMEAACRGAKSAGGTTVGLLPGLERAAANEHVDIALPTGMGELRNGLIVRAADALIAVAGEFGTLSEVAFALASGVPVVGLGTWRLLKEGGGEARGVIEAASPEDAVERALEAAARR
jgi:uncharacterized protein (TIGR00725 family)